MMGTDEEIVVRPVGGLGNQLFVYAAGYSLAQRLGCGLRIDPSWYAGQSKRQFELDAFDHGARISSPARTSPLATMPALASRVRRRLKIDAAAPRGHFLERSFLYDPRFDSVSGAVTLEGFFQSPKYFAAHAGDLRARITTLARPSAWFLDLSAELEREGPWLGLHVRRGDFLESDTRDFHGLADIGYYQRAVDLFRGIHGETRILVFTDSIEGADSCLRGLDRPYDIVTPSPESRPIESILLMARSAGLITANSSFSWWGAWLGDAPDRTVVCPRPWFDSTTIDDRDLLPSGWITLGR